VPGRTCVTEPVSSIGSSLATQTSFEAYFMPSPKLKINPETGPLAGLNSAAACDLGFSPEKRIGQFISNR
jgi:hypothetical protein